MPRSDWTTGPAKNAAGGFVGGAAAVGLLWGIFGRTPAPQPEPPAPIVIVQPGPAEQPGAAIAPIAEPPPPTSEPLKRTPRSVTTVNEPQQTPIVIPMPLEMPVPVELPPITIPDRFADDANGTEDDAGAPDDEPSAVHLVNINTAPQAELELLPGIGPKLARRIIDDRQTNGPFRSIKDLRRVSGIGEKIAKKLEPLIRFE